MQEQQARQDIDTLLKTYFDGLYQGDPERLRQVFHPQAQLFGEVRGAPYQNTVDGWLNAVASRPGRERSPALAARFVMSALED